MTGAGRARAGSARKAAEAAGTAVARAERAPRQRLDLEERRAQLMALGLQWFSKHSYEEVSIDELARAAGISKGLLFHYFRSKHDFYVATVRAAAGQLLEVASPDASLPPLERLQRGLDAYLDYVQRHGAAYVWLMRSGIGGDKAVLEVVESTRARFAARLLEGLPFADPPPRLRLLLRGWIGFVEAASVEWVATRSVSREELSALIARVLIDSFGAVLGVALGGAAGQEPTSTAKTRRARRS